MTKNELLSKLKELASDKNIGRYQRLCYERFIDDLINGEKRGIYFDFKKAERAVAFLEMMPHIKGEMAGKKLKLEDWQKYGIVYPLFGFVVQREGKWVRRFKIAYDEIARKNGKSMLASGIANYLAFGDGESGAEVYAVATKRDQAKIVWEVSDKMKDRTDLKKHVNTAYSKMKFEAMDSVYEPLGADSTTLDGLNVHGAVVDEYHAHPNSDLYDVIRSATGARQQPLIFIITTAGFNKNGPCYQERKYAIDILEGTLQNDSYFVFIATIDEKDDPFNEEVWIKANPNLGIGVDLEDFRDMAREARDKPSALNNFLTKKLNVWADSQSRWISTDKWNASYLGEVAPGQKAICYAGLDLSSTTDITALVLLFPKEDGTFDVSCKFWVPKDTIYEREKTDKIPYSQWAREGWIEATEGSVIDDKFIEASIKEQAERYNIKLLAYDRWNSSSLIGRLEDDGITDLAPFGQGFASMSAPTKEIETLVLQQKLNHGNNPVLTWMMGNVSIKTDPAGNIKIDKSKSSEKVDGPVALAMATGAYLADRKTEEKSVYEERGMRSL